MTRKKLPGKKKLKRTQFGQRAIAGARRGSAADSIPVGKGRGSVQTGTVDVPGKRGRTDVAVIPYIRKDPKTGELRKLTHDQAVKSAMDSGDYVRVKGGHHSKTIEKARAKGDKKSTRFSKKLGKIHMKGKAMAKKKKAPDYAGGDKNYLKTLKKEAKAAHRSGDHEREKALRGTRRKLKGKKPRGGPHGKKRSKR